PYAVGRMELVVQVEVRRGEPDLAAHLVAGHDFAVHGDGPAEHARGAGEVAELDRFADRRARDRAPADLDLRDDLDVESHREESVRVARAVLAELAVEA